MVTRLLVDPCLIGRVRDPFGWLGNMSPHPVARDGVTWPTAEALFQALRFPPDAPIRRVLLKTRNPMTAKMLAKSTSDPRLFEPLSEEDLRNMRGVLELKHAQHEVVREVLASTAGRPIVEDVSRRRNKGSALFWGAARLPDGSWEGLNWLGELWTEIRT